MRVYTYVYSVFFYVDRPDLSYRVTIQICAVVFDKKMSIGISLHRCIVLYIANSRETISK